MHQGRAHHVRNTASAQNGSENRISLFLTISVSPGAEQGEDGTNNGSLLRHIPPEGFSLARLVEPIASGNQPCGQYPGGQSH